MDTRQLIAQIQTISADYESALVDAGRWRELIAALADQGYGSRITPARIALLIPSAATVATVAQESKDPKRFGPKPGFKSKPTSPPGPTPADPGPADH